MGDPYGFAALLEVRGHRIDRVTRGVSVSLRAECSRCLAFFEAPHGLEYDDAIDLRDLAPCRKRSESP